MTGIAGMKPSECLTSSLDSGTAEVAKRSTLLYFRSLATAASCFSVAPFSKASRLALSLAALEDPAKEMLECPLVWRILCIVFP